MPPSASRQSQQRTRRPASSRTTSQPETPQAPLDKTGDLCSADVSEPSSNGRDTRQPRKLSSKEREEIRKAIQQQLGEGRCPRDFQVEMVIAQEEMRDAMCHAATGLGKTLVAAAPFALDRNKNRVTIMVSPLIALQNEMVESFRAEYGVSAIAINSSHGGCSFEVMESIVSGEHNIILISPEMLLSEKFISNVLKRQEFQDRIYALFVDEAHCVSHWGASFRKTYGRLGVIRAFLPRNIPVIAVSASLTPRVADNVMKVLQFRPDHLFLNIGNNQRNVSLVVRCIHNKADSYTDLDFVVPPNISRREDIKKAWIYADNIHDGADIVDHIRELLPLDLHDAVRPYNAMFGNEYRAKAMQDFRDGKVRILVCTDAAGMGCNIPDVDIVVQWKLPEKFSSFVQRAGRAARGEGRTGIAILLTEPSAYSFDTSQDLNVEVQFTAPGPSSLRGKHPKKTRLTKEFAELHGRYRGQRNGARNELPQMLVEDVHIQDTTEGMHAFVQTVTCRRKVQQTVFNNPNAGDHLAPCCDICDPSLLDHAQPGIGPKVIRNPKLPEIDPHPDILASLLQWREDIRQRDFANTYVTGSTILPSEAALLLASLGSFTKKIIEGHLSKRWHYWQIYGEELCEHLYVASEECALTMEVAVRCSQDEVASSEENLTRPAARAESGLSSRDQVTDSTAVGAVPGHQRVVNEVHNGCNREEFQVRPGLPSTAMTITGTGTGTSTGTAESDLNRPPSSKRWRISMAESTCRLKTTSKKKSSSARANGKQKQCTANETHPGNVEITESVGPSTSNPTPSVASAVTGYQMVSAESIVQLSYGNPSVDTVGAVPHLHLPPSVTMPPPSFQSQPTYNAASTYGYAASTPAYYSVPGSHHVYGQYFSTGGYGTTLQAPTSTYTTQPHYHSTPTGQESTQDMHRNPAASSSSRSTSFRGFRAYEGPKY